MWSCDMDIRGKRHIITDPAAAGDPFNTRIHWEEQRTLGLTEDMIKEREPEKDNLGEALGNPGSGWWANAWVYFKDSK
jgi:hypothetical protein